MRYLKQYAKVYVWLGRHPITRVSINTLPLTLILILLWTAENHIEHKKLAFLIIGIIIVAWPVLFIMHRQILKSEELRLKNPEQSPAGDHLKAPPEE